LFRTRLFLTRLFLALILLCPLGSAAWAELPEQSPKQAQTDVPAGPVPDNREASFEPSPVIPDAGGGVALPTPAGAPQKLTPAASKAPAVEAPAPVELAEPVATEALESIDPETVGLLAPSNGGLGAALWKDTPRALVERLLPEMGVPTFSPTLNSLARRLLLTIAAVPQGAASSGKNLTALRLEKLVALGQTAEAWKLASKAKTSNIDELTLRLVVESALTGPEGSEVCAHVPEMVAAYTKPDQTGAEWQKALIVCQLLAKDTKAAQVGLDLMREQKVKDDVFLSIANRNVIGGMKLLPRQLTPLRPLTLALLRQTDLPLPPELFGRPEASMIPDLLQSKAENDEDRLTLAEKAAAKGIISAAQLGAAYAAASFPSGKADAPDTPNDTGAKMHAFYYQAAQQDQGAKRMEDIRKIASSLDNEALSGAEGQLLGAMIAALEGGPDNAAFDALAARIMTLAGKPEQALAWLNKARAGAAQNADVAAQLNEDWPFFVLSGLVPDDSYNAQLKTWLDAELKENEKIPPRAQRQKAGSVLLLLSAAGYAVPEDAAVRVIDVSSEARKMPAFSPVLFDRLRQAGTTNRRGEAVLLSVLMAGGGAEDVPLTVTAEAVRALRLVGLTGDAQALAREAVVSLMAHS
jgi:hypothetical protein